MEVFGVWFDGISLILVRVRMSFLDFYLCTISRFPPNCLSCLPKAIFSLIWCIASVNFKPWLRLFLEVFLKLHDHHCWSSTLRAKLPQRLSSISGNDTSCLRATLHCDCCHYIFQDHLTIIILSCIFKALHRCVRIVISHYHKCLRRKSENCIDKGVSVFVLFIWWLCWKWQKGSTGKQQVLSRRPSCKLGRMICSLWLFHGLLCFLALIQHSVIELWLLLLWMSLQVCKNHAPNHFFSSDST